MNFQYLTHFSVYTFVFCISSVCIGLVIIPFIIYNASEDVSSLRLVHVIFRHGDRHPGKNDLSSSNPYYDEKYYKEGYGQLTNKGKKTAYNLGSFLRKRYNQFLTDYWNIKYLSAQTSDYDRTKMSLELLLAALYPPKDYQQWSSTIIDWQPIPYSYVRLDKDRIISSDTVCGDIMKKHKDDLMNSPELAEFKSDYDKVKEITLANTDVTWTLGQPGNILFGVYQHESMGFPLEPWMSKIYLELVESVFIRQYHLYANTTDLRRITAGPMLQKILNDTSMKLAGISEQKIFLYSGHEANIAIMLIALKAATVNVVPPFSSYILFEVHEIDGVYGIKLFYSFEQEKEPIPIKLPDCDYFCPYDKFYGLVEDILPLTDNCG